MVGGLPRSAAATPSMLMLAVVVAVAAPQASAKFLPSIVVVAVNASAVELLAARELARLLPPLAGDNNVTIVHSTPTVPHFAVGHGAASTMGNKAGYHFPQASDPYEQLGNDSFALLSSRSYGGSACAVAISGCQHCVRGALFGVYELLRRIGVQFIAEDETVYPVVPPATLPIFNLSFTPSYEYRDILGWPVLNSHTYGAQLGLNGPSVWSGYRCPIEPAMNVMPVQYANPPGFVHTALRLLDDVNGTWGDPPNVNVPPELRRLHPEWFSLNESYPCEKGADPSGTYLDGCQLCWSAPGLQEYMLKQVMLFLRASPDATVLSISNMDNANKCIRPAELAIVEEEGSDAGPILRAVNFIAAGVEQEFAHVSIDLLAYSYATNAPTKTKARPNVIVRMALGQNHAAPASDATNRNFTKVVSGWGKLSNRLYLWTYNANFCNFVMPHPIWQNLGPNTQFYHTLGVRGIFEENVYGVGGDVVAHSAIGPATDILNNYVMARIMWDVTLDPKNLTDEWLVGYHGPVGGAVVRAHVLVWCSRDSST